MPRKRLTAQMVERISPPATGQIEYFDRNMPGFALRASYSGAKSWVLMTRVHGKLARITLGEWPVMSLAAAHAAAQDAKTQAKAGLDPREVRRRQQGEAEDAARLTFARMADQFLSLYAEPKLRARTVGEYRRMLKGPRTQAWQDKPIAGISRRDVMALLDGLETEGKLASAKLSLAYLRKFFGWCAERDVIAELPTQRLRVAGAVKPRERALGLNELRRVWAAAGNVGGVGGSLVKVLILTGQRRFETSAMRWRDLSGLATDGPLWSIPGEITKNHRPHQVPLAPEAAAVIRTRPVILSTERDLAFTTTGATAFSGWSKLKRRIDESIAEDGGGPLTAWTLHDLRRSLVTGLNEHGLAQPHVIEAVVNHVSGLRAGIAGVYNRAVYMDERRRALEAWAMLVTSPTAETDKIVPLRTRTNDA